MQPAAQPAIQDAMADEKPAREEPEPLKHQSDPGAITSKCWKITNDFLSLPCWLYTCCPCVLVKHSTRIYCCGCLSIYSKRLVGCNPCAEYFTDAEFPPEPSSLGVVRQNATVAANRMRFRSDSCIFAANNSLSQRKKRRAFSLPIFLN